MAKTASLKTTTARAFRNAKPAAKLHPADQLDRDALATAVSFNTFFRQSPSAKISRPAETLVQAIAHADNIVAELKMDGRKGKITPIIYAIQPTGAQSPVAADIIDGIRAGKTLADFGIGAPAPEAPAPEAPAPEAPKVDKAARRAHLQLVADAAIAEAPEAAVKAKRAPKAPKAEKAPKAPGKRAGLELAAASGTLPTAPDFSAETHKRFRGKLAELVKLVEAGDIAGLKAFAINPISSSPKALDRYRNLAVIALEFRALAALADEKHEAQTGDVEPGTAQ